MKMLIVVLVSLCLVGSGCDSGDALKVLGGVAAGAIAAKIHQSRTARQPVRVSDARTYELERLRRENAELKRRVSGTGRTWL